MINVLGALPRRSDDVLSNDEIRCVKVKIRVRGKPKEGCGQPKWRSKLGGVLAL